MVGRGEKKNATAVARGGGRAVVRQQCALDRAGSISSRRSERQRLEKEVSMYAAAAAAPVVRCDERFSFHFFFN